MAYVHRSFTKYVVYYLSGNSPAVGVPQDAEIDCFTADNQRAGALLFYPENLPLPANRDTVNGIYLYFRPDRFADLMTLLREEKPLYLGLDTVSKHGCVGTSFEPVGEQELQPAP
jgi:hypothetical protein